VKRQRQRFAKGFFVNRVEAHSRATRAAPGAALRDEGLRCVAHEPRLLLRCELHHSRREIPVKSREDASIHTEIGMVHVRRLDRAGHAERDPPEVAAGEFLQDS
jgi:hypothetical protein